MVSPWPSGLRHVALRPRALPKVLSARKLCWESTSWSLVPLSVHCGRYCALELAYPTSGKKGAMLPLPSSANMTAHRP
eukprot:1667579-Pyramimonas_sp.AAC.1